jgi:hypothetical protein
MPVVNDRRALTLGSAPTLLLAAFLVAGCGDRRGGADESPRIDMAALGPRNVLRVDPGKLPPGARAHLPALDGDPVFVALASQGTPARTTQEVLSQVVVPVLDAMGFDRGPDALTMPPDGGVTQPGPRTTEAGRNRDARARDGAGRVEIQYAFQQVHEDVPIEHAGLIVSGWSDQGVTSVRGTLFNQYRVGNRVVLDARAAVPAAIKALGGLKGVRVAESAKPDELPRLVLLGAGTERASRRLLLRYAYRISLPAALAGQGAPFLLWLDAERGDILRLETQIRNVNARGTVVNRDPANGTSVVAFQVDPASNGQYTLRLLLPPPGVSDRVACKGPNCQDVSVPDTDPGLADFAQPPISDVSKALCADGPFSGNRSFQQVNVLATLLRHRDTVIANGIFAPFPRVPWAPTVEDAACESTAFDMKFGACAGYRSADCPKLTGSDAMDQVLLNYALDNTMVAHEFGHQATWRLTYDRPADYCQKPDCLMPIGWGKFHDLADFWAAHLEGTNCIGGWVAKNMGGKIDQGLHCDYHSEAGGLPRRLVAVAAEDRFPEHRKLSGDDYGDGQIAGAALWEVRLGVFSMSGPLGLAEFGVRFQAALRQTGFLGLDPPATDTGQYRRLYDLELALLERWASLGGPGWTPSAPYDGQQAGSKVTAGFARAGLFLIPYQCLDGHTQTKDPLSCPSGKNGGDAVIDVDDTDTSDDPVVNGVLHPERDFLKLGGPAPTFQVWTGPRYRLDGPNGGNTRRSPAPCNARFSVEVSTDLAFPVEATVASAWQTVSRTSSATSPPPCFGTWTPEPPQWTALQAGGAGSRVYYRARTQTTAGGNERLSTQPGNGLRTLPPPYAVITATGRPDY